jgi:ubiquinone/menaquinone biosynthesis C-methylase UbiE
MKSRPETIENRWDILYRDYPEVYEEFSSVEKVATKQIQELFDFKGKVVADVGSGTGKSSFNLAPIVKEVIGIEIENSMRKLAEKEAKRKDITNVRFMKGDARSLPLEDNSVDVVIGITLAITPPEGFRDFIREAIRATKNGGMVIREDVAPGWNGGELDRIIRDKDNSRLVNRIFVKEFGFKYKDVYSVQEYGSLDRIIRTYGFIFGKNAIDYLKKHNKTSIKWKFRFHYKRVAKPKS